MTYINGSSTTYFKGLQSINIGRYDGDEKGRFNVLFFLSSLDHNKNRNSSNRRSETVYKVFPITEFILLLRVVVNNLKLIGY